MPLKHKIIIAALVINTALLAFLVYVKMSG